MKVIIGLSGGVDSAVSALLLQQQGHAVEALFMKNWEEDDDGDDCRAAEDLRYAEQVARQLDIPLHTANFSDHYWEEVFSHFLDEYRCGRTPNPDLLCNREIKFSVFLDHAENLGADKIAMGHYAGCQESNGAWQLLKGLDPDKDQSYFLHLIEQKSLAKTLFPLAELKKTAVRALAKQQGFDCADRKDSTGICFINQQSFREFMQRYLPAQSGAILDEHGAVIGEHQGAWYYTIGQRQGIGLGGVHARAELPWYVVAKDVADNTLTVVQGNDHPALYSEQLTSDRLHWIGRPAEDGETLTCKIRHRQADQTCRVTYLQEDVLRVDFEQAQRSVAAGQACVFYDGRECLGGGIIIDSAHR